MDIAEATDDAALRDEEVPPIHEPPTAVETRRAPLFQAIQLLQLLKEKAAKRLFPRSYIDGSGVRYDVVCSICIGFFQQRIGEFVADVEQLQRIGEVARNAH